MRQQTEAQKRYRTEKHQRAGRKAARTRKSRPKTPSPEQLLHPLTARQRDDIRGAVSSRQATQLLRDWPRLSEVAWWHVQHASASKSHTRVQRAAQRKALATALGALDAAAHHIDQYLAHWGPIRKSWFPLVTDDTPETFAGVVQGAIGAQRQRVQWFVHHEDQRPACPAKRGRPTAPQTHWVAVLLAYFRYRGWDDTVPPTDLSKDDLSDEVESPFVKTVFALFGHVSMMPTTRKALAASSLDYAGLEGVTPVLNAQQRKCGRM